MYPIEIERMEVLRPLVPHCRNAGHMALVHAVIDAHQTGFAFADNATSPRSALVFNHGGFAFALGEPRADLFVPLLVDLTERFSEEAQTTALWCTTPAWADALRPHFCEERARDEFHFDATRAPVDARLPSGYRLQPLDEAMISRWGAGLDPWVVHLWGGAERFARSSFGTGVYHEDELVADCVACAIGGTPGDIEAEIEIATAPSHRRRGLATAAATAFFEQCRARELIPAWSCDSRNTESRRLAEQLGFTYARSVVGFRLRVEALARNRSAT